MSWFLIGAALAFAVSAPPGANTMMCVVRGRQGFYYALPLIVAAASADTVYALLAGAGLLGAALAGASDVLSIAAVGFLLLCAYLLWPRQAMPSSKSAVLVAAFNPPAALLWLALAGSLNRHPGDVLAVIVFAAGAAAATATWFAGVAFLSHKFSHILSDRIMRWARVTVSLALVALACLRAALLF